VSLNSCRLSNIGEQARDELLKLVYPDGYDPTMIRNDTGLEYGKTIPKILGKKDGGLQLRKLTIFFKKLLGQLQDRFNDDEISKYIQKYKFTKFCQDISSDDLYLTLPKNLYLILPKNSYQNTNKQPPMEALTLVQSPDYLPKAPDFDVELIKALWHLDYEAQENTFKTALKSQNRFLAFTIAAPCSSTQAWILNRLLLKTIRQDNHKIFTVDLKQSGIRNNFQSFLIYWSECFKTTPDCENISDEICRIDSNLSVILVINNFRNYREIQKLIMTKFWNELCKKISSENRSGRIIMLWVDERHLDYPCSAVELSELKEINQINIQDWINEYGGLYPFLNNLSTCNFISDDLDWGWNDPWLILNNICQKFKLDGITDLQKLWKWTF
jgi:hypothetical protein